MAKKSLLPRGFKANAERIALQFRKDLNLDHSDPLCGFKLAEHLKITVYKPTDIFPPGTDVKKLVGTENKNNGWSALTMKQADNSTIIIHNHLHAPSRQQSDIMHELAHIICEHKYETHKDIPLPTTMREFNLQQEEEANYLGSTLQITRESLLWALKRGMEIIAIAEHFNASSAMVKLRINSTGVLTQLNRRRY